MQNRRPETRIGHIPAACRLRSPFFRKKRYIMIPCGDCHVDAISRNVDLTSIDIEGVKVAYLSVEGMGCANCATRVRNGFLRLNGFLAASVSLEEESAVVAYDPREVTLRQLLRAVNKSGTGGKHRYWPNLLSVLSGREALPRLMQQKM